jgi:hypothetical protein
MSHPFMLAFAHFFAAVVHQLRREVQAAHAQAEAAMALCPEQGLALYFALATILQGGR